MLALARSWGRIPVDEALLNAYPSPFEAGDAACYARKGLSNRWKTASGTGAKRWNHTTAKVASHLQYIQRFRLFAGSSGSQHSI